MTIIQQADTSNEGPGEYTIHHSRILLRAAGNGKHAVKKYPSGGSTESVREPSSSWFNYILIGAFAITAIVMLLIVAASLIVPPMIQNTVERYTSDTPMQVRAHRLPETDQEELDDRVEAFADAIEEGQSPEPLILSGEDLNSLLQKLWEDEEIPGEMALRIEDGRLRSDLSIPLKPGFAIGPFNPDVVGRYLNGTVTFRLSLDENHLNADIERFVVNGKALPGWIVGAIEREFIDREILQNKDLREFTQKLARLQVSADSILLEAARP